MSEFVKRTYRYKVSRASRRCLQRSLPDFEFGLGSFGICNLWANQKLIEEDPSQAVIDHHDLCLPIWSGGFAGDVVIVNPGYLPLVLQTIAKGNDADLSTSLGSHRRSTGLQ